MSIILDFPQALGSGIVISSSEKLPDKRKDDLYIKLNHIIEDFDHSFSRFRADSLVSALAGSDESSVEFPEYAVPLFDIYDVMFAASGGTFTPTVAEHLVRMGYGHNFFDVPSQTAQWGTHVYRKPDAPHILHTTQPVQLDFGAAGKGYLVDLLAAEVKQHLTQFTVNAGGDIFTTQKMTVGFENPWDFNEAVGVIELEPYTALCASAPSRRRWTALDTANEVHHLVNALTGKSATTVAAVWSSVHSQDAPAFPTAWADALSTALFICAPEDLLLDSIPPWSCARLLSNKQAEHSANWDGTFFRL
ncbi:FAD:protein FMN transferase [Alloscardovia omnicolens]|uniref:FAD:protein FMN transferase n=1 Tax=Alloscardovia omnicolens TaxID=419015 RepID=UPI003A6E28DA